MGGQKRSSALLHGQHAGIPLGVLFQADQVGYGGGDIGQTGGGGLLQAQLAASDLVKQDQWHGIKCCLLYTSRCV